ncbi:hypothetical protein MKZ38_008763 [Zalerion maritima]|uniref:Pyroglutamyl-peptidase I n=1 Tax=Zalerion maritima TaxID=339359 RepID=A0AAD5RUT8_9PEZI|nr:hypothetical protein MKZ38_008763 [Zalerion maritima]
MGSRSPLQRHEPSSDDEFNVLVTGFGSAQPFKDTYPKNPSWEIAASLPEYLPLANPHNPDQRSRPKLPPVRIYVHPAPIRVSYRTVRAIVPKLWAGTATREDSDSDRDVPLDSPVHRTPNREANGPTPATRIDIVVHIGMAGPRHTYQVEMLGHRDGYAMSDVDGKMLGDDSPNPETGRRPCDEDDWAWKGTPNHLVTDVDIKDVHRRWMELLPGSVPLILSTDPGRYLCDFIYFSSLAYLYRREERRRVVFLHVPCDPDEKMLQKGRQVALGLIQALVESHAVKKKLEEVEP